MDWIGESFEWDRRKEADNWSKHGVDFATAEGVFDDPQRVIAEDQAHSGREPRYFCIGRIDQGILTVRYTLRESRVRIIGAGYWRKGRRIYEKANQIHGRTDAGEGH